MMKTKSNRGSIAAALLRLVTVAALVAAIGFSFAACPADTGNDGGVLAAPNLTGWYNASNGNIELSWNEIDGAVGYYVYMGLDSSELARSQGTRVNSNYASAPVLQAGYIVYFQVAAVDRNGNIGRKSNAYPVSTGNSPAPNTDIVGVWNRGDIIVTVSGSQGTFTQINSNSGWKQLQNKGLVRIGDVKFRNLRKTGDRTWSGQELTYELNTYVLRGFDNTTFTVSADGRTLNTYTPGIEDPSQNYTRQ